MSNPSFKSFEAMILYFNGMYKLPISPVPSLQAEIDWQQSRLRAERPAEVLLQQRLSDFFGTILRDEVGEWTDIKKKVEAGASDIDILVDLADLLGDIQVYCASEMARYGLPNKEVLKIIMDSNFSKLGADGQPIYDANGKVQKGPNYWKPEPKIKELLESLIELGDNHEL